MLSQPSCSWLSVQALSCPGDTWEEKQEQSYISRSKRWGWFKPEGNLWGWRTPDVGEASNTLPSHSPWGSCPLVTLAEPQIISWWKSQPAGRQYFTCLHRHSILDCLHHCQERGIAVSPALRTALLSHQVWRAVWELRLFSPPHTLLTVITHQWSFWWFFT